MKRNVLFTGPVPLLHVSVPARAKHPVRLTLMLMRKWTMLPFFLLSSYLLPAQLNQWTWVHGSSAINQHASFGTLGVAAPTNYPGPRNNTVTWVDASGQLWLFGGNRLNSSFTDSLKNDMWKWSGSQWTWMKGPNTVNQPGVYGTQGVAAAANIPGARSCAVNWADASGNIWMFGGYGVAYSSLSLALSRLNDLWKWDGTNWTWVKGSPNAFQAGTYGTKGVASATNTPGGKNYSVTWKDASGNAWVFGGLGYNPSGSLRSQNELWKWDGTNWAWVSGNTTGNQAGTYGTKGVAAASNIPGARYGAVSWNDAAGNGWVFGGQGYDSSGTFGYLSDLWKWDGTNWTWMGGSKKTDFFGIYGTVGVSASTNWPGARSFAVCWRDNNGHIWMMGGKGNGAGSFGTLNDIWKWDGTNWTWVSGSNNININGTYGTLGVSAATNTPGAKDRPAVWRDYNNAVWIFGGNGFAASGGQGYMNDMWRYVLHSPPLPLQLISFTGHAVNHHTLLQWTISSDKEQVRSTIERSPDGRSFLPIGTISPRAADNSPYEFTDTGMLIYQKTFYRLKMTEMSGRITYSSVITINPSASLLPQLSPNPAQNNVSLILSSDRYLHTAAVIFTNAGTPVTTIQIRNKITPIDISRFTKGVYYLLLYDGKPVPLIVQ